MLLVRIQIFFNFIRVCKGFLKAFRLNFPLNLDEVLME